MQNQHKTRKALIAEIQELKQEISELRRIQGWSNKIDLELREGFRSVSSANEDQSVIEFHEHLRKDLFCVNNIQKIIDAIPFNVLLIDEQHKILLGNKKVSSGWGLHPKNIIGKSCSKMIHNSEEPLDNCPLKKSIESGMATELEFFDVRQERWLASAIYPTEYTTIEGKATYLHIVQEITSQKESEEAIRLSLEKLERITEAGIHAITVIAEKRDPYTAGHQHRVSNLAYRIAKELKIPDEKAEGVRVAGLLHDIGKIAIPIEILCKPGKISVYEMYIIRNHPLSGYEILKDIEFPWPIAQIILQHHERMDGSGYPNNLLGKDMMIEAKILSVADVVEAMHSHRPYRPALGIDIAIEEISRNKGILYDEQVVEACLKVFGEGNFKFDDNVKNA